jgi:hypothetical protein
MARIAAPQDGLGTAWISHWLHCSLLSGMPRRTITASCGGGDQSLVPWRVRAVGVSREAASQKCLEQRIKDTR